MRRLLCGLLLPAVLACGKEKTSASADRSKATLSAMDLSGIEWGTNAAMADEFLPAFLVAFKNLSASEKPLGQVYPFGGRATKDRFILIALNAPSGDDRVVRFFVLTRGGDNSAPPSYETAIPYGEGRSYKTNRIADRDQDGLADIEYCRFNGVDSLGVAFLTGYKNDWYRISMDAQPRCVLD